MTDQAISVLHAFKLFRPATGGIVTAIDDLVTGAPGGVTSGILYTRRVGDAIHAGSSARLHATLAFGEVLSLPLAPAYLPRLLRTAPRYDLLAVHSPFPIAELAAAFWSKRLPPVVVHWHSDVIAQRRAAAMLSPVTRRFLDHSRRIIVATPGHVDTSPWLQQYSDKCDVVPFGIRLDAFDAMLARQPEVAPFPGLGDEPFGLFVGRLVPYKGLDYLLEAVRRSGIRMIVAGNGPRLEPLRKAAAAANLVDRFVLLGSVTEQQKAWLLSRARFLALPSVGANETFGIVQLEAMAARLPVVNTDAHPGIGWVARNNREALTVPQRDANALADAMDRLIREDELRSSLGRAGRERVEQHFRFSSFVDRVFAIYREATRK